MLQVFMSKHDKNRYISHIHKCPNTYIFVQCQVKSSHVVIVHGRRFPTVLCCIIITYYGYQIEPDPILPQTLIPCHYGP